MSGISQAADTVLTRHLSSGIEDMIASGAASVVASDLAWAEGPCWDRQAQNWIFSDIPNNRVLSFSDKDGLGVFQEPANNTNGHFAASDGSILCCEHLSRSVTRYSQDGGWATVCDRFEGARLNSPNDVVEAWDGAVWFTDPTYGILTDYEGARAEPEQSENRVYRIALGTGDITAEISDLSMPNGLSISADRAWIFVADSGADMGPEVPFNDAGPRDVYRYPLSQNGHVGGDGQWFCKVLQAVPDGIRTTADGGLWVASGVGLERFDHNGERLGVIRTPKTTANFASGGPGDAEVLVTATDVVYRIGDANS